MNTIIQYDGCFHTNYRLLTVGRISERDRHMFFFWFFLMLPCNSKIQKKKKKKKNMIAAKFANCCYFGQISSKTMSLILVKNKFYNLWKSFRWKKNIFTWFISYELSCRVNFSKRGNCNPVTLPFMSWIWCRYNCLGSWCSLILHWTKISESNSR